MDSNIYHTNKHILNGNDDVNVINSEYHCVDLRKIFKEAYYCMYINNYDDRKDMF